MPSSTDACHETVEKQLREVNRELRMKEALFSQMERLAKIGAWSVDLSSDEVTWSEEMYRIYDLPPETAITLECALSGFSGNARKKLDEAAFAAFSGGDSYDITLPFSTATGEKRWVRASGAAEVLDGNPVRMFGTFQDVTDLRNREEETKRLALADPLTGLANRAAFQERTEEQLRICSNENLKSAVCVADLNKFKEINDHLGHEAGDFVLQDISSWLKAALGGEALVSRIGGDEFAITTRGCDSIEQVYGQLNPIFGSLTRSVEYFGRSIPVGISFGFAIFPDDGSTVQQLTKHADLALYRAKSDGQRRAQRFEPSMAIAFTRRMTVLTEFRSALAEEEIVPYYQPIVDLGTKQISGFEALARWEHPKKGLLCPSDFGPVFEDGAICEMLGRKMLGAVTRDMQRWKAAGLDFGRIGFNAEKAELRQERFAEKVIAELDRRGLERGTLVVEFTENSAFGDDRIVVEQLNQLRSAGVRIALDDFGTGYSSLIHLQKLPFDILKIDRSFVQDIFDNPANLSIVSALVKLGKDLGYSIVAEGVEEQRQRNLLCELGCDRGQGYLFANPMSAEHLPDFISRFGGSAASVAA